MDSVKKLNIVLSIGFYLCLIAFFGFYFYGKSYSVDKIISDSEVVNTAVYTETTTTRSLIEYVDYFVYDNVSFKIPDGYSIIDVEENELYNNTNDVHIFPNGIYSNYNISSLNDKTDSIQSNLYSMGASNISFINALDSDNYLLFFYTWEEKNYFELLMFNNDNLLIDFGGYNVKGSNKNEVVSTVRNMILDK